MSEKACEGGRVLEYFDMAECAECGTRVRWDLQDHRLFGFQNCRFKSQKDDRHTCSDGQLGSAFCAKCAE